jgi:hypothetical protein
MFTQEQTLLAACRLVRKRFAGRADLTRRAERGELAALGELAERLGVELPEPNWAAAEQWRRDHAPVPELSEGTERGAAELRLQLARRKARPAPPPEPGRIARLAAEKRHNAEVSRLRKLVEKASEAADLRTATHGHTVRIDLLAEEARPSAYGRTSKAWPDQVGLPKSYHYPVTTSTHVFRLPWGAEPFEADGYVYLDESTRVRSGRGTDLVVERLTAGARKILWRAA